MTGPPQTPRISDYGFLSDCSSTVLVSRTCSIDWWCVPRFDSPSVFARLLDPAAGSWSLQPVDETSSDRDYVGDSLVLRTVLTTASGTVTVTDALSLEVGARGHDIGLRSPHALLRTVEGLTGRVEMTMKVAPRLEYGLTVPRWRRQDDVWTLRGGPVGLMLTSDIPLDAEDGTAYGSFTVLAGERLSFSLAYSSAFEATRGGSRLSQRRHWRTRSQRGSPGHGCTRDTRAVTCRR